MPAAAQEEDTQAWLNVSAGGALEDATSLTLDGSLRWREDRIGGEQQTVRLTIMREIAEGVRIGGGGGIFETQGGATELRPHQELTLTSGRVSARTRLEERFFDGADRMELRFRQLVRYTQPIGKRSELSIDGEYLGLLQTRERAPAGPRDEWRARSIVSTDVSESLTLGLGYLLIYTPRSEEPDRITHIPQGHVTLHF